MVRARSPLPLIGMLLVLAGGAAAPARAATTIINTPVAGPITVNAGDRVEIHPNGSVSSGGVAVTVDAGGELVLFGGSVSGGLGGFSSGVEVNGGTVTMSGGDVSGHFGVILNSGTMTMSSGAVYGPPNGVKVNGGTLTMAGGTIAGNMVALEVDGGQATISGGDLFGGNSGVFVNGGTVTISNGSVAGHPAVNVTAGEASITGGTVSSGTMGVGVSGGIASLSGGSISGGNIGVHVNGGTATVSGGSFSGPIGIAVEGGEATLSGGSISGGTYGLQATGGNTTVRGCNLQLAGMTLSGILEDGTAINTTASVSPSDGLILISANMNITCPEYQTVTATSAAGAVVNYPPPLVANICGSPVTVTSVPASGSTFPVGITKVTCTATNALGNSSSCIFKVIVLPAADLAVSISATAKGGGNPVRVKPGQPLTYTIVVNNGGPHSADNVVVQDVLPASFVFQSATTTQGTLQTPPAGGSGSLTASLGTLAPGGSATVRINGHFGLPKATIPNTASVSTSTSDPNQANNQATVNVIVH